MDINFITIRQFLLCPSNAFSMPHTQKFDIATACQQAAKRFAKKIATFKDINTKSI